MIFVHPTASIILFCDHKWHRNLRTRWMVYCCSLGDKQSIKVQSDSLWEHLAEMEAKCSKLLYRLKLPTPSPSLSTLGDVKSTLDEDLQPNTAWFADSAHTHTHLSLISSPINLCHPPLSCSSKIPLHSNAREEVTKVDNTPTFSLISAICPLLNVTRESFSKNTTNSRPEPEMCMFTGSPRLPKQKWHKSAPAFPTVMSLSLEGDGSEDTRDAEAWVINENEPEGFIHSSVLDILFFLSWTSEGSPSQVMLLSRNVRNAGTWRPQ